jgi:hypothetical protein
VEELLWRPLEQQGLVFVGYPGPGDGSVPVLVEFTELVGVRREGDEKLHQRVIHPYLPTEGAGEQVD